MVKKKRGNLIFKEIKKGFEGRNDSMIKLMKLADSKYTFPDFKKIYFSTGDIYNSNTNYSYSSMSGEGTFPDFVFDKWSNVGIRSYEELTFELLRLNLNGPCINKVGWIGNSNVASIRKKLIEMGVANSNIFEFMDSGNWEVGKSVDRLDTTGHAYISVPQLCQKYKVLIDVEGGGYSGRLKLLLHAGRPLLLVDRPHKEFFFKSLEPYKHYVPVKRDLSDLLEKTRWIFDNSEKVEMIGLNARKFAMSNLSVDAALKRFEEIVLEKI